MRRRPIIQKIGERKDETYLTWVRQRECLAPSQLAGGYPCEGPGIAHHVNGRKGKSRDDRVVCALCDFHHKVFHDSGTLYPWTPQQTASVFMEAAFADLLAYEDETGRFVASVPRVAGWEPVF